MAAICHDGLLAYYVRWNEKLRTPNVIAVNWREKEFSFSIYSLILYTDFFKNKGIKKE